MLVKHNKYTIVLIIVCHETRSHASFFALSAVCCTTVLYTRCNSDLDLRPRSSPGVVMSPAPPFRLPPVMVAPINRERAAAVRRDVACFPSDGCVRNCGGREAPFLIWAHVFVCTRDWKKLI